MRVFLIGFMGSGKSFTGRRLAERAGIKFVDLDEWIEHKEGISIREVFEKKGEMYFRKLERDALREMARFKNVVVSCGGGTPCFHENMQWMNRHGVTIYLRAPAAILAHRLAREQGQRPLLKGLNEGEMEDFIRRKLEEREEYYLDSSVVYEQKSTEDPVAENLLRYFQHLIGH
ncbi:MAG: shikimate kinase [Phaeodactylibacter sp.]|nr:shikimate kinase [Phaeodactylibacter sp.]MCB9288414.1 shikimate kinase [Lewinellaceae bacterium]